MKWWSGLSKLSVEVVQGPLCATVDRSATLLAADIEARIERIWNAEKARRGTTIFNGRIFSVVTRAAGVFSGFLADYRWFIAQQRDPSLREHLNVRPLSVSGFLTCGDGAVIGRRGTQVEQNPGEWELLPSGTIDPAAINAQGEVDFARALHLEMREEIGIGPESLTTPLTAVLIIEDKGCGVIDVVLRGALGISVTDVLLAHGALENREYEEVSVVPLNMLNDSICPALTDLSRAISTIAETTS